MVLALPNYVEYLLFEILSNSSVLSLQTVVESSSTLALQRLELSKPMDLEREDSKEDDDEEEETALPRLLKFKLNPSTNNPLPASWRESWRS